jgi:hypothetical protein
MAAVRSAVSSIGRNVSRLIHRSQNMLLPGPAPASKSAWLAPTWVNTRFTDMPNMAAHTAPPDDPAANRTMT